MSDVAINTNPVSRPLDKRVLAIGIGLLCVGFVLGQNYDGGDLPWVPKKQRPFLSAIARVAKFGLWLMVVEPVPEDVAANQYTLIDCDAINHREGW